MACKTNKIRSRQKGSQFVAATLTLKYIDAVSWLHKYYFVPREHGLDSLLHNGICLYNYALKCNRMGSANTQNRAWVLLV